MESEPLYGEGVLEYTENGVLCRRKTFLVQAALLPILMNTREETRTYSVVDFQDWIVLVGPRLGDAGALPSKGLGDALRTSALKYLA